MVINTLHDLLKHTEIPFEDIELLPICHTTSYNTLVNKIIPKGKELRPDWDESYKEDLLFFFYGKAKYVKNGEFLNIYTNSDPFTLIYEIDAIIDVTFDGIYRFVCFDSGGFERYKTTIDRFHFEISECHTDLIKKFIKAFYNNNSNYLNSVFELMIDPMDFPFCQAIRELKRIGDDVNKKDRELEYGEQALTIELQVANKNVKLNPKIVVMPDRFFSSDNAIKQFKSLFENSRLETYKEDVLGFSYHNMSIKVKEEIEKSII